MVVRVIRWWQGRGVEDESAEFGATPFGMSGRRPAPNRTQLMWAGVVATAAILPALFLGIGHSQAQRPAADQPATTQALAVPPALQQVAAISQGPAPAGAAQPDRAGTVALIRNVLIAVQQANETGNYTVLRDLGAPAFQTANNAARLSDIFAGLRARNFDISASAAVDPDITTPQSIGPDGMMRVAGTVPASPAPISFDLSFTAVEGRWLPFSISIALAPAATPPSAAEKRPEPQAARQVPNAVSKQRAMAQPLEATRTQ